MSALYLLALLVSLSGMVVLDRRFALFFWRDARRAATVLGAGLVLFVLWDITGIATGVFFRGESAITTGVLLGPEFPLEEIFFLLLLCYSAINLFAGAELILVRRRSRGRQRS
ncbi:lycopene cyclase domain-containing protein [Naasia lichenicola]|uniref:Lycopene cyclase domain-containing protein n=1 Tax=Naasia lichenicola TaxID=2565933 RepID=A0A4V3WSW5_9MICO|nr:lycopene cyclase domain-containing protein [Naasia lichenicola]THG29507.1 lycopene cyclase domain-containing protein [Naasia lichenicola]